MFVAIFLDVDGVLNSTHYLRTVEGFDFRTSPEYWIDPSSVEVLNEIRSELNRPSRIVLSSLWRYNFSSEEMSEVLRDRGLEGRVHDTIEVPERDFGSDVVQSNQEPRGLLILRWIRCHWDDLLGFLVLDDMPDEPLYPLEDYRVRTDPRVGLRDDQLGSALWVARESQTL